MLYLALCLLQASGPPAARAMIVQAGETLTVVERGAGPSIVLVPGLFGAAFGYRKVAERLAAAGYHAIVIEPLAVGTSGRPRKADYSLSAQADRLGTVLDSLGISAAVFVSHSVMTGAALRLALARPSLVAGIVSLDGGPAERVATAGFRRAMKYAPLISLFGGVGMMRRTIRSDLVKGAGDPSWVSDSVLAAYTAGASADLDGTLRAYLRIAEAREPAALAPRLGAIACPVRLLIGAHPHRGGVGSAEVRLMLAGLADFRVDTLAGAGAYLQEERPDEVAAAAIALSVLPGEAVAADATGGLP